MKFIPLSSNYRIVIPKPARETFEMTPDTKHLYIKSVTEDEIILSKTPSNKERVKT